MRPPLAATSTSPMMTPVPPAGIHRHARKASPRRKDELKSVLRMPQHLMQRAERKNCMADMTMPNTAKPTPFQVAADCHPVALGSGNHAEA